MVTAFTGGRFAQVDWFRYLLMLYSVRVPLLVVLMVGGGGS